MSILQKKYINGEEHTLYAAAVEVLVNGEWKASIMHTHALHQAAARFFITQALVGDRLPFRIVSVAPSVGFHVLDNHGERLAV